MLGILAIFAGLILCGVGFTARDRGMKIVYWIVGVVLLAYGIWSLTHGGVSFT